MAESAEPAASDPTLAAAVAALLGDGPRAAAEAARVAADIGSAARALARVLTSALGYPPGYAALTARQIAPKPVLYSALVSTRLHPGRRAPTGLAALAPEFTAFLFDQTIDDYNAGHPDADCGSAVHRETARAAAVLPRVRPDWYHGRLAELLDHAPGRTPAHLAPYLLLAAGLRQRLAAGVPRADLADLLHSCADVLAREHLGALAHARPDASVARHPDLVDLALGVHRLPAADGAAAAGCARVESPGLVMVTVSQYLRLRGPDHRGPRALLADEPDLAPALRTLAAVVSLWDDIGDLDDDRRTDAPNVLLGPPAMREAFLARGGIPDGGPVAAAVRAGRGTPRLTADAAALSGAVLAGLDSPGAPPDRALFLRILRTVTHGAHINATFNDRAAGRMTPG
ncbi:hypothetical protein BIV57_22065 [Mangrovactinospora gilvigrisea]|uniref:Uncharacterized protein n=1 Tax=Mangrovactinospora gilvigrisea TaxID=1428644 RepID=A0A1J7C194_9ACTN|nr:hypothetical protein [Mangrovactinospora gilvigrisea]OIV35336.1 hypothetical protein BIV57_22065 [Mangrovactinospora gilvigrisea]